MLSIIQETKTLTMSSSQLADMLGFESKSSINKAIRNVFDDSRLESFNSSLDSRGYVVEYYLPELESKMFVAKHDINYLEMITQFWIDQNKPKEPEWLSSLSQEAKIAISDLSNQRDEAIKTKAQINDKRTATLMNKASQDAKRIKKLEDKLQDVGSYQSLTASKIPSRVDTEMKNNVQSWRLLKQLSSDMQLPPKKVKCERYGEVLSYHVDVIELFKSKHM